MEIGEQVANKIIKTYDKSVRTQFFGLFQIEIQMVIYLKGKYKKVYRKLPLHLDWVPGHSFLVHFKSRFSLRYLLNDIIKILKKSRCRDVIGCLNTFVLLGVPKKMTKKSLKKLFFWQNA